MMTVAKWCVLAACILPIATIGMAKLSTAKLSRKNGGYDNYNPRQWADKLDGWQRRAHAAQINGFEALPLFIASVIYAQISQVPQASIDQLAIAFVGLRIAYVAAYLMNFDKLRTLIWTGGMGVSIALLAA